MTEDVFFTGWFGTPVLRILDPLRLIGIAASFVLLYLLAHAVVLARTPPQRALLGALMVFVMTDIGQQIVQLGNPSINWRLAVQLAAMLVALWGAHRYVYGIPAAPLPPHSRPRPSWRRRPRRER